MGPLLGAPVRVALGLAVGSALAVGGWIATHQSAAKSGVETFGTIGAELHWAALGDSFSSGEGVEPFVDGGCHRSADAYPRIGARKLSQVADRRVTLSFRACSGALIEDVADAVQHKRPVATPPQIQVVSSTTDIASITIGGNDLGFKDTLINCGLGDCTGLRNAADDRYKLIGIDRAATRLFRAVVARMHPGGRLYVLEYPQMFPDRSHEWLHSRFCGGVYSPSAITQAHDLINGADRALRDAASRSGATWVATSARFRGHEICAGPPGDWWFNGLAPGGHQEYSFHPTSAGQHAMAAALLAAIDHDSSFEEHPHSVPASSPEPSPDQASGEWTGNGTTWRFTVSFGGTGSSGSCASGEASDTVDVPFSLDVTNTGSTTANEPSFFTAVDPTPASTDDLPATSSSTDHGHVGLQPGGCDNRHDAEVEPAAIPAGQTKPFDGTVTGLPSGQRDTNLEVAVPNAPNSSDGDVVVNVPIPAR